ncbi:PAS domain-containing sensor histidine kinase [Methylovirgula sp. 4M-Z18]|nr:PAS domain-containing sensor histidine kinase [Methylovirgula sp. 4M-Z18]
MKDPAALHNIDETERPGHLGLLILLLLLVVGAIAGTRFLPPDYAFAPALGLLVLMAFAGVFFVIAYGLGGLQSAGKSRRPDMTRLIADTTGEALLAMDGETQVLYANAAYRDLAHAEDTADLPTIERLFAHPDAAEAIYRLAQAARERKSRSEEVRLSPALKAARGPAWYRIAVRPLDGLAAKRAVVWSVNDVTGDRDRQENVFLELQHAIDYLDHAPAGFFSIEPDGRISYINATLAHWLDHDLAQVGTGGLTLTDLMPREAAARLLQAPGNEPEQFDLDLRRRNGSDFPATLRHSVSYGKDGTPRASRTLVLPRQAVAAAAPQDLQAAESRFARFFNLTPMAIASLDQEGRIVSSNPSFARLFPALVKGQTPLAAVVAERDRAAVEQALQQAAQGSSGLAPVDAALDGESGKAFRFFLSSGEGVHGAAVTLCALDTTEQRTLQENFAQSQKMQAIGQLAGGVAHDFNNVLTAIIGYSDLLLAKYRPTDPSFQDIMQIKQNANRAAGLVRQLLAFSRRQTLRPHVLQLGDVLSELQMMLTRLVGEKINLDVKHGRDLWLVKADVNQLEQVILNLVVNARDALPQGGRIQLRTSNVAAADCAPYMAQDKSLSDADYVLIEVEDDGAGIPADILPKIFEPFFTTKEVGKGTGLGLSMVYGIVKQTGGVVSCDSVVGRGTVFRIFLPRYVPLENDQETKKETAKAAAADLTGRGTILLVEDEEAVRAFGARALSSRGYTVLEAGSGVEALEVLAGAGGKIDLIVSDVVMPEMDGPTMLGEIRKQGITAKVIFVSGYAEDAFAKNLPQGEDFGFLPKPFTLKQMIEAVKGAMG